MKTGELCRILIVDDEQLIRQGIKHYLQWEQVGFQIVGEASNGKEALEMIEKTKPHIILTDIVMPIMDGEELTRVVKSKYPQIEIIILSSYGEFDYVRSTFQSGAVDYILKPKLDSETLLKVLTTAANRIPSLKSIEKEDSFALNIGNIIDKLIAGYEIETDYDSKALSQAFPHPYFSLFIVDSRNLKNPENVTQIKSRIEKELDSKGMHYHSFTEGNNVSGYLLNIKEEENLEFTDELLNGDLNFGILITNSFNNLSDLGMKFNEVIKKMLQYRFYFPELKLMTEKELPTNVCVPISFNLDKFTNDFKHERFDLAFSYLEDYVKALSNNYTTDMFEYKSFFGNIIFNITILLGNMNFEVNELENKKFTFFNCIDEATSANEVIEQLNIFILEAKKCIAAKSSQTGHSNITMILEYIEEHFAEPLSLTGVAHHFHFNPTYLSSYFASHNREGFNEYLNKIRIEEAAKLLVNKATPISEISGLVGYSDHSYFCKVFKKLKGVSPSQYRRSQKLN
ncbi:two-component system response regulator YesN [Metabacillus crassostreae]|uniref:response regulator transcription factor n=1 Tax=Metabacillus crassostreae TaxID=929098 RepID=UPI00195C5064|nr:response regulator transcription factor [Metabacillus crassostreae]MBM7604343.1 two-component system response regulator YesN [Metabacillus crassostreae]